MQYPHLHLAKWPFQVVPDRTFCTFLADRRQVRKDVAELLTGLSRRSVSSIQLFWAWFGAGKTHTLFYLANQAKEVGAKPLASELYPIYSEFPKAARGFVDLYRSFVLGFEVEVLIEAFLEINTCGDSQRLRREMMLASPDLANALKIMATGETANQITAARWLRAEALPAATFRSIGLSQKIGTAEEAMRILVALIEMLATAAKVRGRPGCRVIWLLDEFQRIERTGSRILNDINTGLHSTFNACPTGFSLFLSFSGNPDAGNLPKWFSPELRDRIGRTKVILLPPMVREEALEFVRDVLAHCRPQGYGNDLPYFPFTLQSCETILDEIQLKDELRPRALMNALGAVLQEADAKLESGAIASISPKFAKDSLAEYVMLSSVEEEQQ
jgi:hypothetical protein